LIQRAVERRQASVRRLAAMAGISEGRWRQIVNGYQSVGRGDYAAVTAPALTLARMARTVGVDSDALRAVGRADAADELDRLEPEPAATVGRAADLHPAEIAIRKIEEVIDFKGLTDSMRVDTVRGIIVLYRRDVARSEAAPRSEDEPEQRLEAG
jgi:hypothetical protein